MSQMNSLNQTASEVTTLGTRGYKLLSVLGKGSYAKVYLSDYRPNPDTSARTLACKVVDTKKVTKNFANKFLPRELDILGKINHPHIIQVHSIFQRRNRYFIFMRLNVIFICSNVTFFVIIIIVYTDLPRMEIFWI